MPPPSSPNSLRERLTSLGKALGEREAGHAEALEAARIRAGQLHQRVASALAAFHEAAASVGADHLAVELGEPRLDEKHVRAVEFDLRRGRHRAVVTTKSRGEVTLVGPFHMGKVEGPCKSFSFDAEAELELALGDLLAEFLEEAFKP